MIPRFLPILFALLFAACASPQAPSSQTLVGKFLGIEQGDYAHWNMRTSDGNEHSFFVLHPDASLEAVLAAPAKFKGRACRITWKKTRENLPEAGGSTVIEEITGVDWLSPK